MPQVDISENRKSRSWSRREYAGRFAWWVCSPLFRFSPRPFWVWRSAMLRIFGAKIGGGVHIHPTVRITIPWNLSVDDQAAIGDRVIVYALGAIHIGARATISQNTHLCAGTHELRDPARRLVKKPITVGDDAWLCADTFVGPGVTIGAGAVLGARAVAMIDLAPGAKAVGNPMQVIGMTL